MRWTKRWWQLIWDSNRCIAVKWFVDKQAIVTGPDDGTVILFDMRRYGQLNDRYFCWIIIWFIYLQNIIMVNFSWKNMWCATDSRGYENVLTTICWNGVYEKWISFDAFIGDKNVRYKKEKDIESGVLSPPSSANNKIINKNENKKVINVWG